jgi:hypothetical protein
MLRKTLPRNVFRSVARLLAGSACVALMPRLAAAQPSSATDSSAPRRRIQPFPAVASAPETGLQLGVTVLAVFEPPAARHARPASVVATAIRSFKGQTRLSVEGERWAPGNARRLWGQLAWQRFPLPWYGVGAETSDDKELYTPQGVELQASVQQRLTGPLYVVAGARWLDQSMTIDSLGTLRGVVGATDSRIMEWSAGVLADSRDYVFAPTRGGFAQLTHAVSRPALGSDWHYQRTRLDARQYLPLGHAQVLAAQVVVSGSSGAVPFDQLPMFGAGDMMRGYTRGRFRDAWSAAAQLEYRSPMVHGIGAVLFGGAGTVAPTADALADARILPTFGAGLRVQIDARQRTAVRIDMGRGRDGASGLYIGFNQAF